MSSQMVTPTGTPATGWGRGCPGAGGEPPLLVEHAVVGEQALVVATEHLPAGAEGGRVDQATLSVDVHVADHRRAPTTFGGNPGEYGAVVGHEGRPRQEVLGRIAGHRQLGEHGQVGPGPLGLGQGDLDPVGVAVEVAHHGVDLARGDAHSGHGARLPGVVCPPPAGLFILRSQSGNGRETAHCHNAVVLFSRKLRAGRPLGCATYHRQGAGRAPLGAGESPCQPSVIGNTSNRGAHVPYQAEYIWIDGTEPSPLLRSKTKIVADGEDPGIWGFDGSSTNQALGHDSDCVLRPVFIVPDPLRGPDDKLVMCEVELTDFTPHPTNTRAKLREVVEKYADQEPMFGIEQEYTFFKDGRPLGWPALGYPAPQGPYYCGVGGDKMPGREIVELHTAACIDAGIGIEGTNAEVMMGQWEFQVGVLSPLDVSDHLWVARWLLFRIAEDFGVYATLEPKPILGDWNGAGAHTNFSTKAMRADGGWDAIIAGCEAIGKKIPEHIAVYGVGIEGRLTGAHETEHFSKFSYGTSDRGASIRIPWAVAKAKKGWLEDRRPNANMDPYQVTAVITETVCSDAAGG